MNRYRWMDPPPVDSDAVAELASTLAIPASGARVLVARGYDDAEAIRTFLAPGPDRRNDPFAFERMHEAVAMVRRTVEQKSSILIHGDYDVDGISGTAILYTYLEGQVPTISRFVPDRRRDGYGLSARAVEWAISRQVGLFIAVDCGTSDADMIDELETAGVDVIVCDHHQFPPDGRAGGVMLNPVRAGESYPFAALCGAGVAFKLIEALHASGIRGSCTPEELVDLMALATVGDQVSLTGENRYYVRAGLERLNRNPRPGIGAMRRLSRYGHQRVTARAIAFGIAPRLNAPGRVSHARPALELLCETDSERASALALRLESDNERRRELTAQVYEAASHQISRGAPRKSAYVLAGSGWDEGVLGIAAARVAENTGRPAILMSVSGNVAKGSGRSVAGIDLKFQLDGLGEYFDRYGGHAAAVGLTMRSDRIDEFRERLCERLLGTVTAGTRVPLYLDGSIDIEECNDGLLKFLSACEPWGQGNREPVWKISDVQVLGDTCLVGNGHMKLFFQDTHGHAGQAIAFGWDRDVSPEDLAGRSIDLAATLHRSEYMGRVYPELRVVDVRYHGVRGPVE